MASLTDTAYYTRRTINWIILGLIAYFILRFFWGFLTSALLFLFPPRPAPPNHRFNKLPVVAFPAPESSPSGNFSIKLETISGSLPRASDSARVYFMSKSSARLPAIINAQNFAKKLSFDPNPIQENKTVYRFNDTETPLRKLQYDIVSNNFVLNYRFEQDTGLFTEGVITDPEKIVDEAKNFLRTHDLFLDDFSRGTTKTTLLKLVGNTLMPVDSISQTNAVRVDFFRGSVNKFSLVTPRPDEGQIRILFSPSKNAKKRILEVVYTNWPIEYEEFGTYKIKTSSEAWLELQNGQGFIAKYPDNGDMQGVVRNVYLAYYDSFDPQTYLQPVFVFEGDHEFKAYVPAIVKEWVE